MKQQTKIEIWVGIFVLISIISLAFIAFKSSNFSIFKIEETYNISAKFSEIGGLKVRAPVKISGVEVGRVKSIYLDQKTSKANVTMYIYKKYNKFPEDTSASILTSGLLGEQYIGLNVGGAEDYLQDGDQIFITQSALVLENLIGKLLVKISG